MTNGWPDCEQPACSEQLFWMIQSKEPKKSFSFFTFVLWGSVSKNRDRLVKVTPPHTHSHAHIALTLPALAALPPSCLSVTILLCWQIPVCKLKRIYLGSPLENKCGNVETFLWSLASSCFIALGTFFFLVICEKTFLRSNCGSSMVALGCLIT